MCLEISPAYFEVIYRLKLVRKVYRNIVNTNYLRQVNLPYPQVVLYVHSIFCLLAYSFCLLACFKFTICGVLNVLAHAVL